MLIVVKLISVLKYLLYKIGTETWKGVINKDKTSKIRGAFYGD